MQSSTASFGRHQRADISRYAQSNDARGLTQILSTLGPLTLLWCAVFLVGGISYWLTVAVLLLISLFNLRVFALMHECGHGSLSRTRRLNRGFGFLLGHRGDAATRLVATL